MQKKSFKTILNGLINKDNKKEIKQNIDNELIITESHLIPAIEMLKQKKIDGSIIILPKMFQTEEAISRYYQKTSSPKKQILSLKT